MHELTFEGKLLEMLIKAKPAGEAGFVGNACFLKLVAGAHNSRFLRLVESVVPRLVA
jgi:hypothetical protein